MGGGGRGATPTCMGPRQCLVPRPHYCARPASFKCGQGGPIVSDTSPKCNDREGLRRRRTGTRQG